MPAAGVSILLRFGDTHTFEEIIRSMSPSVGKRRPQRRSKRLTASKELL
jgi:hypothetical protein